MEQDISFIYCDATSIKLRIRHTYMFDFTQLMSIIEYFIYLLSINNVSLKHF